MSDPMYPRTQFKCSLCDRDCNTPCFYSIELVAGTKYVCGGCYHTLVVTPKTEHPLDRCAKLERALQYVAQFGRDRPISRIIQVCQLTLDGHDCFNPLREPT